MRLEVYLGFRVLSRPKTDKIVAQYFCLEFILRTMFLPTRLNIIAQYFIPLVGSGRVNMLSGTDAACVAIASVLCLDKPRQAGNVRREKYFQHTRFYIVATDKQQYIHFRSAQIHCSVLTM